jgi:hypothetical protein|tara:strand:+ start:47 stop:457 length:411 start_codon:yes stop_codon:yes gene_type:complete
MSTPFKMKYGNSSFPFRTDLTKKTGLGPKATPKKEVPGDVDLSPGFEDPIKIQKLQREGLTPSSQTFVPKKKSSPTLKKTTNIPEDTNVGGSGKETSGKYKGMSNNREDYTSTYNFVNRHVHFAEKNRLKAKKNSK